MKRLVLFAALIGLTAGAALANDPAVGAKAPDFSLFDTHGKKVTLSDAQGKFVVLEWTNYGCPFVKKHYDSGNMQKLQREYTGKGVVWYSICSSAAGKQGNMSPDEWNKAIQDKDVNATAVLLDPKGEVGKTYGAKTTPHMFVVDDKGILVYKGAIDNKASTDADDIPSSRNYVRNALDEAMAGKTVAEPVTQSYGCSVKYE